MVRSTLVVEEPSTETRTFLQQHTSACARNRIIHVENNIIVILSYTKYHQNPVYQMIYLFIIRRSEAVIFCLGHAFNTGHLYRFYNILIFQRTPIYLLLR